MIRRAAVFLGLTGSDGNLSFNKSVTAVMCGAFVYAVAKSLHPTWELLTFGTVIIGSGFGLKGYLAAMARQTTNAQVSATSHIDAAAVVKAIRERRDEESGTEATP